MATSSQVQQKHFRQRTVLIGCAKYWLDVPKFLRSASWGLSVFIYSLRSKNCFSFWNLVHLRTRFFHSLFQSRRAFEVAKRLNISELWHSAETDIKSLPQFWSPNWYFTYQNLTENLKTKPSAAALPYFYKWLGVVAFLEDNVRLSSPEFFIWQCKIHERKFIITRIHDEEGKSTEFLKYVLDISKTKFNRVVTNKIYLLSLGKDLILSNAS